mmetsp:Transcript_14577/g.43087  ORF Transcript_14577/g.43087 Transcript_14577/m.43087 type:complete len:289 (-) Transcript_14577:446-1312(-)
MADDAIVFLVSSGKEAWHVHERDDGDVESVGKPDESGSLDGRVNVEASRKMTWVVGDDCDSAAFHPSKGAENVLCKVGHDLEHGAAVHHLLDDRSHVVAKVRVIRHEVLQAGLEPVPCILGLDNWHLVSVAQGQIIEKCAGRAERIDVVLEGPVRDPRQSRVGVCATKLFLGDFFVRYSLHDVRTRDKHVRRASDHEDEVRHRRRVHGATSTGAHDQRYLWHNPRGNHVLLEHVGVPREGVNALLDASTAGVVQSNNRGTHAHSLLHDLDNLLSMGLRQRAPKHGEVL